MAEVKISALTAATSVASADLIPIVQGGVTKKATGSLLVDDTAYDATSWNAVTTTAPSKNAVRDKFEALTDPTTLVSDTAYNATSWDAVTTVAPSKNAVRDKIEALQPLDADLTSWAAITRGTGFDTAVAINVGTTGAFITDTSTNTLTNKRVTKRTGTTASTATPSINTDTTDVYYITALATAITSLTFTGTPTEGQSLLLWIKDNGGAQAIAFGTTTQVASTDLAFPTTTTAGKYLYCAFAYNSVITKFVMTGKLDNI